MALPASHCRFALNVANQLPIADTDAYLSGTIYPDSRWHTGLSREKTHGENCLKPSFATSDFRLGWFVHCWCDRIQKVLLLEKFPQIERTDATQQWVALSVAKMAQDQIDLRHVDMDRCSAGLTVAERPNGEAAKRIQLYYQGVRDIYSQVSAEGVDYARLWRMVGLDRTILETLMARWAHWRESDHSGAIEMMHAEMVRTFAESVNLS